ncbi:hypothetical protein L3i20_v228430 [Paenibacillus sp. L3-i20]|nr:hypothetical protein L3i20_v228430 [Paenibacillus sp. L3-i20]
MNSEKKSMKTRLILGSPSWIFAIVVYISLFWLSNLFVELGLKPQNRIYITAVVTVTFIIGFLTSNLVSYLQSKYN